MGAKAGRVEGIVYVEGMLFARMPGVHGQGMCACARVCVRVCVRVCLLAVPLTRITSL